MSFCTELDTLEEKIGYHFSDTALLQRALTHTSYANEQRGSLDYERLEFLGDAVLEAVSSAFLYRTYPEMKEGDMSRLRASLVCEPALAYSARLFGLENFIRLGRGEEEGGGRGKDSIVSDVCEAVIGAIYLDCGETIEYPRRFILKYILSDVENRRLFYDAKSSLQERCQKQGLEVRYELLEEIGPAHDRSYRSAVFVGGIQAGVGEGKSKKLSEQHAAYAALSAQGGLS